MDKLRLSENNELKNKMRNLTNILLLSNETIIRLSHQKDNEYNRNQIAKLTEKIIITQKNITDLENRQKKLLSGELDEEINNKIIKVTKEVQEKKRLKIQKKKDIAEDKAELSAKSLAFYKATRKAARQYRYNKRGQKYCYKHFVKACNSIPDYMRRQLSRMPANRGFFWKSVACYGELRAVRGEPTILTTRKRGGITVTHEWTETHYNIYEKKKKGKTRLVSSKKRNRIFISGF